MFPFNSPCWRNVQSSRPYMGRPCISDVCALTQILLPLLNSGLHEPVRGNLNRVVIRPIIATVIPQASKDPNNRGFRAPIP